MRIIHAIDSLGIGGAQVLLFELYYAIDKYFPEYKQIIILLNKKHVNKDFVESYGIKYYYLPPDVFSKTVLDYNREEPTVLLFHKLMNSKTEIYNRIYGNLPTITVNHTFTQSVVYNRIATCDAVVSVCRNMRRVLRGQDNTAIHKVIYNGVNWDRYEPIQSIPKEEGYFVTGRMNALNTIKYSKRWLEWISKVHLPKPMIHEYLGGGGFLKSAKQRADEYNKESNNIIRMFGSVKRFEEKIARLKSWDVFLYEINRDEGVSVAILEALACGIPVICSDHFGNKEIIEDGINGYVFEGKKEATRILTDLCNDPDRLKKLKETTLSHFKDKLDAKIMASGYVNLIERLREGYESGELPKDPRHKLKGPKKIKAHPKRFDIREKNKKPKEKSKEKPKKTFSNVIIIDNKEELQDTKQSSNEQFTILTASYNNMRFVKDWSHSIFKQKYRPLEVVFVDDCSTDNTSGKIIELYPLFKEKDILLKVIKNEKREYCGSSYKIAWQNATSKFFGVLDSDDALICDAVDFIMNLYQKYSDIGWIYTQYNQCDANLSSPRRGMCCVPNNGGSLLDLGKQGIHAYSHWRTFSSRVEKLDKIWSPGLRSSVDKFMGYRLEEWGKGMFVDRICYNYRLGTPSSISKTEKAMPIWRKVISDAESRRKRYHLKPKPIMTCHEYGDFGHKEKDDEQ